MAMAEFTQEDIELLKKRHDGMDIHHYSMVIFKRKRAIKVDGVVKERKYKVTLEGLTFREPHNWKTAKMYWVINYFVDGKEFDNEVNSQKELDMMFEWVETRQEHFEDRGNEVTLWKY